MELTIRQLLPVYFDEKRKETSEIWGKDLVFSKGDLVKIIAPSGSGKTSLVSFLYGLRKDFNGTILFDKQDIRNSTPVQLAELRKNNVSIVLQDLRLFA